MPLTVGVPDASFSADRSSPDDETALVTRTHLSFFALCVVILCLVVLAGTPIWLNWRMSALRKESARTTVAATAHATQLRFLLVDAVTSNQAYRLTRNPARIADYRTTRMRINDELSQLLAVAPTIDWQTVRLTNELQRVVNVWEAPQDARANGILSDSAFEKRVGLVRAQRDSTMNALAALDAHVAAIEAGRQRAGELLIARQEMISFILGPLAIIAGALVAWLALRERKLTRALSTAYQRERGLRAESEQRRVELVHVTESKTRLLRGFTHDVKNPLGAADGFLALLQENVYGTLAARQADVVARVRRSLRDALKLIGDLLEMAKAEAGDITLHFERVELCSLLADVADEFRGQASDKGLETRVTPECRPLEVDADVTRLRQVLGNLVSNAVKYTDTGFVELCAHDGGDGTIAIDVVDSGRGIPADKQHLLFEEFVRLDPTAAEGVGIGLASTRRIVEAMGAEITVVSQLGRGSTFTLHLPSRLRRRRQATVPVSRRFDEADAH